jgi:hypothetical protein
MFSTCWLIIMKIQSQNHSITTNEVHNNEMAIATTLARNWPFAICPEDVLRSEY